MKKKSVIFAFFTIFLINVIIRYPSTIHSNGSDSFLNIKTAEYIFSNGNLGIFAHWLSYFGLYAGTRNMGGAFLLSALSQATSMSVEYTMFLLVISLLLISQLGVFLISKQISRNDLLALISIFLFTTSRKAFYFTDWNYSYRGPFLCLLPLVFLLLIRRKNGSDFLSSKESLLLLILVVCLSSLHRLAYFLPILILVFIIVTLSYNFFTRNIKYKLYNKPYNYYSFAIIFSVLSLITIFSNKISFYKINFGGLASANFIEATSFLGILQYPLVLIFAYTRITSILFPFIFFGLFVIYQNPFKNLKVGLLVLLSLIFPLFAYDMSYASMFFLPFLIILNSFGVYFLFDLLKQKGGKMKSGAVLVTILLTSTLIVPTLVDVPVDGSQGSTKDRERQKELSIRMAHDLGIFLRYKSNNEVMSSYVTSTGIIESFCDCSNHGVEMKSYFNEENMQFTSFYSLISGNSRSLYEEEVKPSRDYKYNILLSNVSWKDPGATEVIEYEFDGKGRYNFISESGKESFANENGKLRLARLPGDIANYRYMIYDNGFYSSTFFTY